MKKQKSFTSKLNLNKKTISKLNTVHMGAKFGGAPVPTSPRTYCCIPCWYSVDSCPYTYTCNGCFSAIC